MSGRLFTDDDLHALVDGRLDDGRRIEVERWVASDAEALRTVDAWRTQNESLRALFDPVAAEEIPPEIARLTARLRGRLPGNDNDVRRVWFKPWMRAVAAGLLLCAGATGGWLGRGVSHEEPVAGNDVTIAAEQSETLDSFVAEAATAHRIYTADDRQRGEMGGDDPSAINNFLSERVGRAVSGPDLSPRGYRLTVGRSLPTEMGPGAQFVYVGGGGQRLTLLAGSARGDKDGEVRFAQQGDMATFYWVEGGLAYALIGRASREELTDIAKMVYAGLKKGAPPPRPPAAAPGDKPAQPSPASGQPAVGDARQPKAS